ncbi:PR46b [Gonium pectorale]|uniref:PR46b n=1 Tax=Gonium pectorale TaxID=33097 RepID=A0A150GNU2_GONPE|nr:PR46b [Gonium pectorale]|eukprot:KXZ50990.1 PR46b [Gonium pectorale]
MVLTAHLKPITAPSRRTDERPLPCWSFGPDGKPVKEQSGGPQLQATLAAPDQLPSTSSDFYRDWRRYPTPDDRYRYLVRCGPDTLRAIFRVEVSAEALREILAVLEACWLGHGGAAEEAEGGAGAALREAAFVVRVLEALSAAGRFTLTVRLLGSGSKPVLERLFGGLEAAAAATAAEAEAEGGSGDAALAAQAADGGAVSPPAGDAGPSGAAPEGRAGGSGMCGPEQLAALRRVFGV